MSVSPWLRDPNPVWMRELRQSTRLQRTPVILAVVTSMMALLMASVGGIASVTTEPARVGVALFHTFFSLAFAVVTWVAPAVAASTIASERGGRTWDALVLTGLGAERIARGKFLAALTYISMYIVMLAPVGVLPFLFGGVTATEVVIAFVYLFLIAALSTAFGLSISSAFASPAAAIVVTLLVAVPVSMMVHTLGGFMLSIGMHELWPGVSEGLPIWLPTAYIRADFGLPYVAVLLFAPLAFVLLPAWFLYEVTVANMRSPSDDRSTGLRRWFLVSLPIVALVTLVPTVFANAPEWWAVGLALTLGFLTLVALVFAGEPLAPPARVELRWQKNGVGPLTRYFGPGLVRALSLLLGAGVVVLAIQSGVGAWLARSPTGGANPRLQILAFGGYATAFFVFIAGFVTWSRARSRSPASPRLLLLSMLFLAFVGPWMVMAIAGALTDGSDDAYLLAAPSPTYAALVMNAVARSNSNVQIMLSAAGLCAAGWTLLGLGLFGAGTIRARKITREQRAQLERLTGSST